jgi:hypothetical protein
VLRRHCRTVQHKACLHQLAQSVQAQRQVLSEETHASLSRNGEHVRRRGSSSQPGGQVLLRLLQGWQQA